MKAIFTIIGIIIILISIYIKPYSNDSLAVYKHSVEQELECMSEDYKVLINYNKNKIKNNDSIIKNVLNTNDVRIDSIININSILKEEVYTKFNNIENIYIVKNKIYSLKNKINNIYSIVLFIISILIISYRKL